MFIQSISQNRKTVLKRFLFIIFLGLEICLLLTNHRSIDKIQNINVKNCVDNTDIVILYGFEVSQIGTMFVFTIYLGVGSR